MPYGRKPARAGCRLADGTFGFQADAAMRKDLAAAAAIPSMRGIEGLQMSASSTPTRGPPQKDVSS
jgi:hypothetical protein